jgi:hypothetical protein
MELPVWASWILPDGYLPSSFHSRRGFQRDLTLLQVSPRTNAWQAQHVLAVGLALRDIMRQQVMEEGELPDGVPTHLANSDLTMDDLDKILECPAPMVLR